MNNERKGFIFMPSYYDAICAMSKKDRLAAYDALCAYAFFGTYPEGLSKHAMSVLHMAMPLVDSGYRSYEKKSRKGIGGNPNFQKGKPNPYYAAKDNSADNSEDNSNIDKDNNSNMDKEREKETDRETRGAFGPYGNVFLSSDEERKLKRLYPNTWQREIDNLSRHLHDGRPLPKPNHCDSITALFTERTVAGMERLCPWE